MDFSGRRFLLILGIMIGILLVQSTLLYKFRPLGVRPDLILALVGSTALLNGWPQGLFWGAIGGLLEDLITGSLPGSHALAKSTTGFVLGLLEGKVFKENMFLPVGALFMACLAEGVIFFLISGLVGELRWGFVTAVRMVTFPAAVVTAFFAPAVYRLCEHIYEPPRFGQRGGSV
ncbi:MAG: rod shape-determining protein MreD [Firmicutes bacterium]|nr:rod shape-determining protein MreD [Bacillota bacterium]